MNKILRSVVAFACLGVNLVALAQTPAPGLWQHTVNVKSANGQMDQALAQMQQQMAAMPAAQRREMEQTMAQHGVALGPSPNSVRACLSKEDAARQAPPLPDKSCTQQAVEHHGNQVSFRFTCEQPVRMSGEGDVTFTSDKAFAGKVTTTSALLGKPETTTMEFSGRWLGADCGALKTSAVRQP